MRNTLQETKEWFEEVRIALPKTMEEVQQLQEEQARLQEKLQTTQADMLRLQKEAEHKLQSSLKEQAAHFEERLQVIVDQKIAAMFDNVAQLVQPNEGETSSSLFRQFTQPEAGQESSSVPPQPSALRFPFDLSASGVSYMRNSSLGRHEDSISAATIRTTARDAPSVGFTFGSGIAAAPVSAWTFDSNLPFSLSTPGPIFQNIIASRRPTPAPESQTPVANPDTTVGKDVVDDSNDMEH